MFLHKKLNNKCDPKFLAKSKVSIVISEYNKDISLKLLQKCQEYLFEHGIGERYLDIHWVSGAFEIPLRVKQIIKINNPHVVIALGAIIKGDTNHFELVSNECARGIMNVMLETEIPIVFEVLSCYKKKDAEKRAGDDEYNKGISAAVAALKWLYFRKKDCEKMGN